MGHIGPLSRNAIKLNGIMPITFQTGRPHDHLGGRERGVDGWASEEGTDEEGYEKGVGR